MNYLVWHIFMLRVTKFMVTHQVARPRARETRQPRARARLVSKRNAVMAGL